MSGGVQIRVLMADDHPIVRQGLRHILAEEWRDALFGEARDAPELLRLLRGSPWDVVLLDINMPGRSGLDVLKDLRRDQPRTPVLVLSAHPEDQYAMRVLRAGAAGYLTKESAPDELIKAVRKVLDGGKYVSAALAEKLAFDLESGSDRPRHETLSDREYQVLCLLAEGKTPSQIAAELVLSVKTISTFRSRILAKMQMSSNAELTRYAIRHQLVD